MSEHHVVTHLLGNSRSPLNLVWDGQTDRVQVFFDQHPTPLADMTWDEFRDAVNYLIRGRGHARAQDQRQEETTR